ncbi:anti-sigma factor family protein [Sneathiella sp.]|jgi:anti-sigma factor RsiW|uniref:anti-sigma factor family protein n=1 Tax=Sneathiella sp. TaxID=1964365 RepID=UPI0039E6CA7A
MTVSDLDWEKLNSFLDGELPDEEAAQFEQRLSSNAELQKEYQRLISLKASLRGLKPVRESLDAETQETPRTKKRMIGALLAATLLAGFIGIGAVFWTGLSPNGTLTALDLHRSLSSSTYIIDENIRKSAVSTARIGLLQIPDLSLSSLTLVDVVTQPLSGRDAFAMHYRGQNGCQLTVIGMALDENEPAVEFYKSAGLLKRTWSYKGYKFSVLANGMDENRFRAIAAYVFEETKGTVDQLEALQIAMSESYKNARPCA